MKALALSSGSIGWFRGVHFIYLTGDSIKQRWLKAITLLDYSAAAATTDSVLR